MAHLGKAAFVILLSWWQAEGQSKEAYFAVVQVGAWTTTGDRIERIRVMLTPVGGGAEYNANGKLVELSVPTGEYILRVDASGFESRRQILRVYQPRIFRSVALPVAHLHSPISSSVTGTIRNYDGDLKDLRIRLMAVYGNELREITVDSQGSFSFPADDGYIFC